MSRSHGRHAKVSMRRPGRHAKPAPPNPAVTVIGTAAKAVPASLALGAAGSAFALSGTASAATTAQAGPISGSMANAAVVRTTAAPAFVTRVRHASTPSTYTVISGDTLSGISARFCGTPADYPALAAASGLSDPNMILAGQHIKLDCHAAPAASSGTTAQAPAQQAPAQATAAVATGNVGTAGLSGFEACVIARESGGNPQAVNPASGAGGLFQFLPSTWASLGFAGTYPGGAQTAPASVQEAAFAKLYAAAGPAPWAPYDGC
jgi:LysM repeat protein